MPDEDGDGSDARPFRLLVAATDLGQPPLTSQSHVTVFVVDVNDHAPAFQRESYAAAVDEDAVAGDRIIQVPL